MKNWETISKIFMWLWALAFAPCMIGMSTAKGCWALIGAVGMVLLTSAWIFSGYKALEQAKALDEEEERETEENEETEEAEKIEEA